MSLFNNILETQNEPNSVSRKLYPQPKLFLLFKRSRCSPYWLNRSKLKRNKNISIPILIFKLAKNVEKFKNRGMILNDIKNDG